MEKSQQEAIAKAKVFYKDLQKRLVELVEDLKYQLLNNFLLNNFYLIRFTGFKFTFLDMIKALKKARKRNKSKEIIIIIMMDGQAHKHYWSLLDRSSFEVYDPNLILSFHGHLIIREGADHE